MTFSAYTDFNEFQELPIFEGKYTKIGKVTDYGIRHYGVEINGVLYEEYLCYLEKLKAEGFELFCDNGVEGIETYVYTSAFKKKHLVVNIIYLAKLDKVYITSSYNLPLSEHLKKKNECIDTNVVKTKLHMPQLNCGGNSFIIQLKNGHFVIHDGGKGIDAPYLLDYLEELAPTGEKPIVEGWFISHAHDDHYGAMLWIAEHEEALERICVEGFYFHCPGVYLNMWGGDLFIETVLSTIPKFRTTQGKETPCYRPQLGQRYYFGDVVIDVCLTPELFEKDGYRYNTDINDTSIWLMNHIEGQKILFSGDAAHSSCYAAISIYDRKYFQMEMMAAFHHGINTYDYFTDFIEVKTVLFPSFRMGSIYKDPSITSARVKENQRLIDKAEESMCYEEGTVIFEFPYITGTAQIVQTFDWRYNEGKKRIVIDYDNL